MAQDRQDTQHQTDQSSIMSFVTSPNTINLPTYEASVQPAKKKIKTSRKKSSWIWEYFVEGFTDKNEPAINNMLNRKRRWYKM